MPNRMPKKVTGKLLKAGLSVVLPPRLETNSLIASNKETKISNCSFLDLIKKMIKIKKPKEAATIVVNNLTVVLKGR